MTMVCSARLSWRSPPRFSRWRTTRPLDASTGATPASIANAASERSRPGCDQLASIRAAVARSARTVARCSTGSAADAPSAAHPGLLQRGPGAQPGPQRLGGGDQQRLELPAGVGGDLDRTRAGKLQHPQRLPLAALPRAGQVLATQRLAAGADRVQRVALGAVAVQHRGGVGVAVGVDPDDVIDLAF